MSDEWKNSFTKFLSDMGEAPPGTELDRINNDGNYEAGNCKWSTKTEQARNTRRNVKVTLDGVPMLLTDVARLFKRKTCYIRKRIGRCGTSLTSDMFTVGNAVIR